MGRRLIYKEHPVVHLHRQGLTNAAGADTVVTYEPLTNHGDGMEVLYADAHVDFQNAVAARKIVAELQGGRNPPRAEKIK